MIASSRTLLVRIGCSVLFVAAPIVSAACHGNGTSGSGANATGQQGGTSSSGGTRGGGTSGNVGGGGDASPPPVVTITNQPMTFAGNARRYLLAKPVTYDANKAYPLVVVFHGNPANADSLAYGFPFDAASGQDAVIAYPEAGTADGALFDWDIYTPTADNADMSFIKAFIADVKTKAHIDDARVFGFGYSGGAFFISHYACRFGGVFTAISINAGGGPDEEAMGFPKRDNGCFICPGGPVPTLVTHGDQDTEVPVDSGIFTAECYAATNGCNDTRTATTPAPCELYDGCGKPVKRCIIPGQSHAPWGRSREEAWSFFLSIK